jgi:hypothetical protein
LEVPALKNSFSLACIQDMRLDDKQHEELHRFKQHRRSFATPNFRRKGSGNRLLPYGRAARAA